MAAKRVTSIDVARLAGVSQSTVSRTFNPKERVSPEARKKVRAAALELGYRPSAIARSLTTRRTNIVGIVMAGINNAFYPYALDMFTKRLQEMDRQVLLFNAAPDHEVDDTLSLVLQYQVDALIITSATLSSEMADECVRNGTPVILFNRYVPGAHASAVCCDNHEGGRLVANLLLDAGHKRLAYIAGKENTSTNVDREKGFTDRLQERGLTNWLRDCGSYTYEGGREAARRLLQREDRPEAIFCADDIMALAAIDVARFELEMKVPEDVSVIGFDDIPAASWPSYSLTTVRQPVHRMIEATLDLLMERLESPETGPVLRLVPGALVERSSARIARS